MSADLMLIDDNHNYKKNQEGCVFVDETSMGEPYHEFALLLSGLIDDEKIERMKYLAKVVTVHEYMDLEKVIEWMNRHKGDFIQTECW